MVSQLRIYIIKPGMMDSWLTLFNEQIRPVHKQYGIPIEHTWVNTDQTEFIWVRSFDSAEDIPRKEAEYSGSPERQALGNQPQNYIEKVEVRVIETVDR